MEGVERERMAGLLADLVEGWGSSGMLEASLCALGTDEISKVQISVEDALVRVLRGRRDDPLVALRKIGTGPSSSPTRSEEF